MVITCFEAIASGTWSRLKCCRNHACRWAFYDDSKNRSATWCSMQICGNRAKTRTYRTSKRAWARMAASSVRATLSVSWARLRSQPLRSSLVVTGVALAFAFFVAVLGGTLIARQQALARSLAEQPASARRFRIDRLGLTLGPRSYARADAAARQAFADAFRRAARARGRPARAAHRRWSSSRLARSIGSARRLICVPGSCRDDATSTFATSWSSVRSERRVSSRERSICSESVLRRSKTRVCSARIATASGGEQPPVVVLVPGLASLARLSALTTYFRVYSWIAPLATIRHEDVGRATHPSRRSRKRRAHSTPRSTRRFFFPAPTRY